MLLVARRSACSLLVLTLFAAAACGFAAAKEAKNGPAAGSAPKVAKKADAAKNGAPKTTPAKKEDAKKADVKKDGAKKDAPKKDADKKAEKKEEKEAESKAAKEKVKKGAFRITLDLEGVFEAQNMRELFVRLQEWNGLTVLKAVEHGAVVKQGDLVLALDTEKIDRMIVDQDKDMLIAALSVKQAEETLSAMEKTTPLELESARRNHRFIHEDMKHLLEIERPMNKKIADFMVRMAEQNLDYQEEEMRQLEKMYKADDIKEETEKIVLKRAQNNVNQAKFVLEYQRIQRDDALKILLPRQLERATEFSQRADIDWARVQFSLPVMLSRQRLELEKLKLQFSQSEERLKKLREDRAAMTVKAPADGIIYYGKCVRGKWSGGANEAFRHGDQIAPNQVVMTLVQARPMLVRITVPEAQLRNVRGGQQAAVEPTAMPDARLPAIVHRVGVVPLSTGGFDGVLSVALEGQAEFLMPGMNCEVKFVPYKKLDALTVPPKAVFTDDLDVHKRFVYIAAKKEKAKPEKREVTVGRKNDKQIEILSGLREGEEVLLERPAEE